MSVLIELLSRGDEIDWNASFVQLTLIVVTVNLEHCLGNMF